MNNYEFYLNQMRGNLPLGECFDLLERKLSIGGRDACAYYVDGLVDERAVQFVLSFLLKLENKDLHKADTARDFIRLHLPYLATVTEANTEKAIKQLYTGLLVLLIEGYDQIFIVDVRSYPVRTVEEPAKEKSLRGAKDGFTETLMTNVALIRRRIRDNHLIFKAFTVGSQSKSDVSLAYMKGKADQALVDKISARIQKLKIKTTTVGEQTLVEALCKLDDQMNRRKGSWINPFPKVRYTQRPDVVAAHVTEGKIALIVDNSPTVILLPVGVFDFSQDVDDYYFPEITGNYFRFLRILNFFIIISLLPVYLLIVEKDLPLPVSIDFFLPDKNFAIPIFWQFILLELAVDGLKLASLNTPESLGMSLSVIGALILGDFAVSSGWLIPQTILCMAIVALASFTQPSIELGYGIKFCRMLMLIGAGAFGLWGAAAGLLISFVVLLSTRTLAGTSYFYPIIPFKWAVAKKLLFRTKL